MIKKLKTEYSECYSFQSYAPRAQCFDEDFTLLLLVTVRQSFDILSATELIGSHSGTKLKDKPTIKKLKTDNSEFYLMSKLGSSPHYN